MFEKSTLKKHTVIPQHCDLNSGPNRIQKCIIIDLDA